MKCKTFKIRLDDESVGNFEEDNLNKFLENLNVYQISSAIVNNEYWSVLIFYNENLPFVATSSDALTETSENAAALPKPATAKISKPESAAAEPIVLSADEEKIYAALREWRNEHSGRDGLPPYMIAHNDSLMRMARANPQTHENLIQVKGFGERRAQKYGDEILRIIESAKTGAT